LAVRQKELGKLSHYGKRIQKQ